MNTLRSPAPAASLFNVGQFNRKNNGMFGNAMNAANTAVNTVANAANTAVNTVSNAANTVSNTASSIVSEGPSTAQIILIVGFIIVVSFMAVFWKQIEHGFKVLYDSIRQMLGAAKSPTPEDAQKEDVTKEPEAPQDDTVHEKRMVEKILPGRQEVFNVSKNTFTYYDAEPLCKALGAELATYEQVKEAYAKGADWCNYGWVKGQMAVYPTQTNTWEQLQQGPPEQRGACGRPGLNGGHFDNPELRFGVSCYGVKPAQKDHDATGVAAGDAAPLSPGGLDFEKKVNYYRGEADSIGILPFSKSAWSS
jgi:hypothetical protein